MLDGFRHHPPGIFYAHLWTLSGISLCICLFFIKKSDYQCFFQLFGKLTSLSSAYTIVIHCQFFFLNCFDTFTGFSSLPDFSYIFFKTHCNGKTAFATENGILFLIFVGKLFENYAKKDSLASASPFDIYESERQFFYWNPQTFSLHLSSRLWNFFSR